MLRRRYADFLGEIYTPEALTASSTDYDRTKMSLLLVLAGLWPPASTQQWNQFISWQPIAINYKPKADDYVWKMIFMIYLEGVEKIMLFVLAYSKTQ